MNGQKDKETLNNLYEGRRQETGFRRLPLFILPSPHTPHPTPHTPHPTPFTDH
ncbi:MAG: hypothetical protein PX481_06100 [Microcystis sp. M53603_WE2]|uniref:hypothetical protein n=1 Tax=Microcystis sp. M53603_WE2 TaxID=3030678 RepID=UPI00258469C2|nr:hypothetical protein [Microcystis sp. M53603_WE2]MDJ0538267.1 hypothetical protein [Microcystis sp. M53603_WE2]